MLAELNLIGSGKCGHLAAIEVKGESGNRSNIILSRNVAKHVCLNRAKNYVFVFISARSPLKNWFEVHARLTRWTPKINNYAWMIFNDFC